MASLAFEDPDSVFTSNYVAHQWLQEVIEECKRSIKGNIQLVQCIL